MCTSGEDKFNSIGSAAHIAAPRTHNPNVKDKFFIFLLYCFYRNTNNLSRLLNQNVIFFDFYFTLNSNVLNE